MKITKKILLHCLILTLFLIPVLALGQSQSNGGLNQTVTINNPFNGGNNLMDFITAILQNVIMPIAAVAVVCYIIWAGFQFVMARGKPEDLKTARRNLMWALIGAAVLLGAAGISAVVKNTVCQFVTCPPV
jgi:hypothetical protein